MSKSTARSAGDETAERKKNMLRAMDSAVAGLRAHQNKLDVISHNIANVNTYGYKSQSYSFKEAVYQTATNSTGGSDKVGGTNASQYGYGASMGSISTDFATGTPTYVGGLNVFINGSGFFVTNPTVIAAGVTNNSDNIKSSGLSFTRVGQMQLNSAGYLTDANGNFVYGFKSAKGDGSDINPNVAGAKFEAIRVPTGVTATKDGTTGIVTYALEYDSAKDSLQASNVTIDSEGKIMATVKVTANGVGTTGLEGESATVCIGKLAIATFQNEAGMTKIGDNYYTSSTGDNTGECTIGTAGGAISTLMTGYLEVSNVDLTKEFSDMITTQRGFQANSKIITVSDEILQELVNMVR